MKLFAKIVTSLQRLTIFGKKLLILHFQYCPLIVIYTGCHCEKYLNGPKLQRLQLVITTCHDVVT